MVQTMADRTAPEAAARAAALDERAMRGEGAPGDAMEALAIVWPAYFATPSDAPPMPIMDMSLPCYSGTWESIHDHLARETLAAHLGRITIPTTFVLGAESPIPPRHGVASAALIPGAETEILPGCGHLPWLERPGVIRAALQSVQGRASGPS